MTTTSEEAGDLIPAVLTAARDIAGRSGGILGEVVAIAERGDLLRSAA
ncbi:MAG: hypothetical protein ACYCV7_04945 [Acidimicrobiales bacterium]